MSFDITFKWEWRYLYLGGIRLSVGQSFLFVSRQASCGANSVKQEKGR